MTERVPREEIENIVGSVRLQKTHLGCLNGFDGYVYILHSYRCLKTYGEDLRQCPFSLALDRGIGEDVWPEDTPLRLTIVDGRLKASARI